MLLDIDLLLSITVEEIREISTEQLEHPSIPESSTIVDDLLPQLLLFKMYIV